MTKTTIIVAEINFDLTNWRQMQSSNFEEALVLKDLFKGNYEQ